MEQSEIPQLILKSLQQHGRVLDILSQIVSEQEKRIRVLEERLQIEEKPA